ncbi:hypothetical protein IAT38_002384 [Cryptococcus sp. DSM 104549]
MSSVFATKFSGKDTTEPSPVTTSAQMPRAITTHSPPDTLDLFLSFTNVSDPSRIRIDVTLKQAQAFWELCRRLGVADAIKEPMAAELSRLGDAKQWDMLVWAGKLGDVEMARDALGRMSAEIFFGGEDGVSMWHRTPGRIKAAQDGEPALPVLISVSDWAKAARSFKPVQNNPKATSESCQEA